MILEGKKDLECFLPKRTNPWISLMVSVSFMAYPCVARMSFDSCSYILLGRDGVNFCQGFSSDCRFMLIYTATRR
jgi:hypothetical protein